MLIVSGLIIIISGLIITGILVAFSLSRSNEEYRIWRNEQLRQSIMRSKKYDRS
jgi:hypothetical protein